MTDRQNFGLRLRRERERRGISLDAVAAETQVSREFWQGLERNDLSGWPSGILARAFVRDYARVLGLFPEELVDEFCRLFPSGDRRAERLLEAQAELVGHRPARIGEAAASQPDLRLFASRAIAAAIDVHAVILLAAACMLLFGTSFWGSAGVMGLLYHAGSSLAAVSPGMRAAAELQQRASALFSLRARRRVHA